MLFEFDFRDYFTIAQGKCRVRLKRDVISFCISNCILFTKANNISLYFNGVHRCNQLQSEQNELFILSFRTSKTTNLSHQVSGCANEYSINYNGTGTMKGFQFVND